MEAVVNRVYSHPNSHLTVQVEVRVQEEEKLVHILDANRPQTATVTNMIDFYFEDIKRDINIEGIDEFEFVVYCTDGIPFLYGKPGFKPVPPKFIFEPFQKISESYLL